MLLMVGILALGLIANLAAVAAAIIRGLGGRPYQGPGPGPYRRTLMGEFGEKLPRSRRGGEVRDLEVRLLLIISSSSNDSVTNI